jgi:hypothetical protein
MRSRAALAAAFALTIGLSACGKYGHPERTVPRRPPAPPEAAEPEPQVPEEEIPEAAEFDGTEAREETDQ